MRRAVTTPAILLAMLLALPASGTAQDDAPRYDPAWHGSIAAATFAGAGVVKWLDRQVAPTCAWCGRAPDGSARTPRIDGWAESRWRWRNQRRAGTWSHGTAAAAYAWPSVALTVVHRGVTEDWGRDHLAVLSSMGVTQFATDVAKRAFRRARPHIVFERDAIRRGDDVHSFFSGHTATAFAAVVSAGTIASRRASPDAPWIWIAGAGLAGSTGYFRVAANRHFLTDVLAGALVGTTAGLLMPRVFDSASGGGQPVAVTPPPLAGLGPVARVSVAGRAPVTLQLGSGAGRLGVIGAMDFR